MLCLPSTGLDILDACLGGRRIGGHGSQALALGHPLAAGVTTVTDWILAVSGVLTAFATLGLFLVALWTALREEGKQGEGQGDAVEDSLRFVLPVLRLLDEDNAERYKREWSAHLWQVEEDGELEEAREDRRCFAFRVPAMAAELRFRRLTARVRRSLNRSGG